MREVSYGQHLRLPFVATASAFVFSNTDDGGIKVVVSPIQRRSPVDPATAPEEQVPIVSMN